MTSNNIQKVLITGGAGFIGSYVVDLLKESYQLEVLDLPHAKYNKVPSNIKITHGDITNPTSLRQSVKNNDAIVHLAADPNLWSADKSVFYRVNYLGTKNLLDLALEFNTKNFVHISTDALLINPNVEYIDEDTEIFLKDIPGAYCQSKFLAEQAVNHAKTQGLNTTILNPGVPLGDFSGYNFPFTRMISDFKQGKIKAYIDSHIHFVAAIDIARAIQKCLESGTTNNRLILVAETIKLKQLLGILSSVFNNPAPKYRAPRSLALLAAYVEECLCKITKNQPMATVAGIKIATSSNKINNIQTQQFLNFNWQNCKNMISEIR